MSVQLDDVRSIPYTHPPLREIDLDGVCVSSFVAAEESNLDPATVRSFGEEWSRFHRFDHHEIQAAGDEYFEIVDDAMVREAMVLDVGCGMGRWARYLAPRARFIECVDPGRAALVAARATADCPNIRVTQASVASLPFPDECFDFVMSLGVLHHVPDTARAIRDVARKVRPGGWLFVYLYYRLDDRPWHYRLMFGAANAMRGWVSGLPAPAKAVVCDMLAVLVYLPLIGAGTLVKRLSPRRRFHEQIPLHYYIGKSWRIIRNDSLDRFGTPLERRFSKPAIEGMLRAAGLVDIRFSDAMPRWRVVARRPGPSPCSS